VSVASPHERQPMVAEAPPVRLAAPSLKGIVRIVAIVVAWWRHRTAAVRAA
jgi:hypothetical protein